MVECEAQVAFADDVLHQLRGWVAGYREAEVEDEEVDDEEGDEPSYGQSWVFHSLRIHEGYLSTQKQYIISTSNTCPLI